MKPFILTLLFSFSFLFSQAQTVNSYNLCIDLPKYSIAVAGPNDDPNSCPTDPTHFNNSCSGDAHDWAFLKTFSILSTDLPSNAYGFSPNKFTAIQIIPSQLQDNSSFTVLEKNYSDAWAGHRVKSCNIFCSCSYPDAQCFPLGKYGDTSIAQRYNISFEKAPRLNKTIYKYDQVNNQYNLCTADQPVALSDFLDKSGVQFTLNGVSVTSFDPRGKSAGVYSIVATKGYYNGTSSVTINIKVSIGPVVSVSNTNFTICDNGGTINLAQKIQGTPSGGTYYYNGNSVSTFDPKSIVGSAKFTYTVSSNGCDASTDITFTIKKSSDITLTPISDQCSNSNNIALNASPSEFYQTPGGNYIKFGVWSTDNTAGIKQSNSYPALDTLRPRYLLSGVNTLTYTYTNEFGCISSKSIDVNINDTTRVPITVPSVCVTGSKIDLNSFIPANDQGGVWSATKAITGSTFDPKVAGPGKITVYYKYSNVKTCKSINNAVIDVLPAITDFSGNWDVETVCNNSSAYDMNTSVNPYPTNSSATWSGQGIQSDGHTFDPKIFSGNVNVSLTYSYTSSNGCTGTKIKKIAIRPGDPVSGGGPISLCKNDKTIALTGSPAAWIFVSVAGNKYFRQGTWSGTGVVNSTVGNGPLNDTIKVMKDSLNPMLAMSGNIVYKYTAANSCVSTANVSVTIKDTTDINVVGLPEYCINDKAIDLTKIVDLKGGVFSGPAVSLNTFHPDSIGKSGITKVFYTYKNKTTGCTSKKEIDIKIKDLPSVTGFFSDKIICKNATPVNLYLDISPVPFGGTFSATLGVSSGTFDPSQTLRDTNVVTYNYTDNNTQCTVSKTKNYIVSVPSSISIAQAMNICRNSPTIVLDAIPSQWSNETGSWKKSGVWSGKNVKLSNSYPKLDSLEIPKFSSSGDYEIVYTFTNKNNCKSVDTMVVTINDTTKVNFGSDTSLCSNSSSFRLSKLASPVGGTFKLYGDPITIFNPATADIGSNPVQYTYTNIYNCKSTATKDFFIKPLPIITSGKDTSVYICRNLGTYDLSKLNMNPPGGVFTNAYVTSNIFSTKGSPNINSITYTATVNGCSSSAKVNVLINSTPFLKDLVDITVCANSPKMILAGSPLVNGNGDRTGHWSGLGVLLGKSDKPDSINPAAAKPGKSHLTFTYTDENNCTVSDSVNLTVNSSATANITASKFSVELGDPIQFNSNAVNGSEYFWDFGDGSVSYSKDPFHYYYIADTVTVTLQVISAEGCSTTVKSAKGLFHVKGKPYDNVTFSPSYNALKATDDIYIDVLPMPFKDELTFKVYAGVNNRMKFTFIDALGRELLSTANYFSQGLTDFKIPTNDLAAGMYSIIINSDSFNKTLKVIKQ